MRQLARCIAAIATVAGSILPAQDAGFTSRIETGVTAAVGISSTDGVGREFASPWSIRLAYVSPGTPWGAEVSTEFSGSRTVESRKHIEGGITASLVRRLGRGSGPKGISGWYASIGYSGRTVAARMDTSGATVEGVVLGIGSRWTIGRAVSIRPEYVVLFDHSRARNGTQYPGVHRSTLRLGVGLFYPQYW